MNGLSIVGSSRNNGEREENDFYPTSPYCTEDLLKRETFNGLTWECACGEGDISKVLQKNGLSVISTNIIDRGYGDGIHNFLSNSEIKFDLFSDFEIPKYVNNIITNPPYTLALDFINKSKIIATDKIAMLLKTVFLESEIRKSMFLDKKFPLKCIYQYSKRVSLYKNGIKLKNSGMIAYAWYVWDKNHVGKPYIDWI